MNSDYEKRLEKTIGRELAELPELAAPQALVSRVMTSLKARAQLPWYRQSWQAWPLALRATSLVGLLVLFAGICFVGSRVSRIEAVMQSAHWLNGTLSAVIAITHALSVLLGSVLLFIKQLGPLFITACLLAAAMGYAFCVSLGTVYFRIALARR